MAAPRPGGTAAPLTISCLGRLRLEAAGRPVELRSARARALLQHLVAHRGGPVTRDLLMETFWPGAAPAQARNSLNQAVTGLCQALAPHLGGARVVTRAGDRCMLNPELPAWVDAWEFAVLVRDGDAARRRGDRAAAVAAYEAAAELYEGHLFADDPYSDWIDEHRWPLAADALRVLSTLWEHHLACDNVFAAAHACRRAVDLEPLEETAHRALMRCYARLGQRSLALRQFRGLTEALRRAGIGRPEPETDGLHRRIAEARPV
jgi:DNA-binding SARP family transcriptional activator